jgi:8-oxo-dGTP pyrophosphatase MutT (NUDIX family)
MYRMIGKLLFISLLPLIRIVIRHTERAYVCIECEGSVLLVKNWLARDTWRFPGGGVSKDERPTQAIVREVYEELHIQLDERDLVLYETRVMRADRLGFSYSLYVCHLGALPKLSQNKFEIVDSQWFGELPEDLQDDMKQPLADVLRKTLV